MLRKLFVLIVAASALGACESSPAVTPPMTPAPATAPVSYMTFFEFASVTLSDQSLNTIAQAAQVYKTKQNGKITVTGYADTVGSAAANMQLSQRRADAVKAGLVKAGVPAAAITTNASGDTGTLVATGPQQKEPRNRRVVIAFN